ncbi:MULTISPECIES: histidine kinase dimerization/phosphoacceptor domain-containing protein [Streptomyces]|uniref:Signal transduction histidine kinase subgroup 3 dimerisation and phosphoacceptor domain-containing protein n=1 Tax=Streptomyces venezuelae TaxID=54571 RepID=A0A5P2ASG5_STRVZ|nr:histidine kinase dimerization/phosphoacceptor domain-containing protein [Streptomyces venezuelae]QES21232.1 hypothetical protein DEJ46_20720 [Streptomyces venezuelae]
MGRGFRSARRSRSRQARAPGPCGDPHPVAHDLHDVVARDISGIVAQAQAARFVADGNPAAVVRPALDFGLGLGLILDGLKTHTS